MKKLLAIIVLLIDFAAFAQNEYGVADFTRNDYWSKNGLVDHWVLDPGTGGNILEVLGDFETWTGTEGGCTDCPTGWTCSCSGTSEIRQEATDIYKTSTSAEFDTDSSGNENRISYIFTLDASACYQVSIRVRGTLGTEDIRLMVTDLSTAYYNFDTDVFQAGATQVSMDNISTSWTSYNYFVKNDSTTRTDYQLYIGENSAATAVWFLDDVRIEKLNTCTIYGKRGNPLSNPVTSDPVWGNSPDGMSRTGTGPAYKTGMDLDGTDDSLSCADATCLFDPVNFDSGGSFSVGCRFIPDGVSGSRVLVAKYGGAGDRSWNCYQSNDDFICGISDDGTNVTTTTDSNIITADTLHTFIFRYNYDGVNLSADGRLRIDFEGETNATTMRGPPYDTDEEFTVGQFDSSAYFDGTILECAMWNRYVSDADRSKWIAPYYPSTNHSPGMYIDSCTYAARAYNCTASSCVSHTRACHPDGTGVLAVFNQNTELLDNNSFETFTGFDYAANFTNWTETENPSGGTAEITSYRAKARHGAVSARMKIDGWSSGYTPGAILDGECQTTGIAADVTLCAAFQKLSDDIARVDIGIVEYDAADCTTQLAATWIQDNVDPPKVWKEYCATHAAASWNGSTSSYLVRIFTYEADQDILVDTVSVKAESYRTPWVHNPSGSGTTTANFKDVLVHNPLSDHSSIEGQYGWEGGWCLGMWVYTDWAGDDGIVRYFIDTDVDPVDSQNTFRIYKWSSNTIYFRDEDGVGTQEYQSLSLNSTNWPASSWKYLEGCTNANGTLDTHHYAHSTGTWYDWTNGGGPMGAKTNIRNDMDFGSDGSSVALDGYISSFCTIPYNAVFQKPCWNNGNPPVNGAPY